MRGVWRLAGLDGFDEEGDGVLVHGIAEELAGAGHGTAHFDLDEVILIWC